MLCTGQGFSQMSEMSAVLDMPCMANVTHQKIHEDIALKIRDIAWEQMLLSGKEEAKLAHEAGDTDTDGIPMITVVADGSWAKRSYKKNYSSLSGVVCTFRAHLTHFNCIHWKLNSLSYIRMRILGWK